MAILLWILTLPNGFAQSVPAENPTVAFEVEPYEDVVTPESDTRVVELHLRFSCSQLELRTLGMIEVNFRLAPAPANVSQLIIPSRQEIERFDETSCADGSARHVVTVRVHAQISRERLAFESVPLRAEAQITYRPAGGDPETVGPYTAQFQLRPNFFPLLTVQPETQTRRVLGGGTALFPIRLASESNGPARVSLTAAWDGPAAVDVVPAIELSAPILNRTLSEASVTLSVEPRPENDIYPRMLLVRLDLRMASADERGIATEEQTVHFVVETLRYDPDSSAASNLPLAALVASFVVAVVLVLIAMRWRRRV